MSTLKDKLLRTRRGQRGHAVAIGRYGGARRAGVGMFGLLVHVQTHVVAVLLGTDGAREVLPHWVHPIRCYQRGAGQTKMSTALYL